MRFHVRRRPDYNLVDEEMKVPSDENVELTVKDCLQVLSLAAGNLDLAGEEMKFLTGSAENVEQSTVVYRLSVWSRPEYNLVCLSYCQEIFLIARRIKI